MLELWYEALASRIGIVIETDNVEKLRQLLYQARRESGDAALHELQLRRSPTNPNSQVWIVKSTYGKESDGTPGVEAP